MKKGFVLVFLGITFLVGAFYLGFVGFSGDEAEVISVDSEQFEGLLGDDDVFVLQVHEPYYGEIDGTDLVLEDWENIENYLDELPEKNEKIAIYCRSGRMSGIVAQELADLGYENVYDLSGGMNAWEDSRRNLVVREI